MLPIGLASSDLTSLEYRLRTIYGKNDIDQDAIWEIDQDDIWERALVKSNLSFLSVFHSLDEAIEDMDTFIEMEPDQGWGYRIRAEMLSMKLMDLPNILTAERNLMIQRIKTDYLRAREIDPTSAWAWLGLIEASLLQQNWDEAISAYGQCVAYIKTPEDQLIRALLGCVALALAGELIDKEDSRPLHGTRFSEDEKYKFKKVELGKRLARLRHLVINKLRGKENWDKNRQVACDVVNKAIIEFNAWPKFSLHGRREYGAYEDALELRWVNSKRVITLKHKAQAVKIEMSSGYLEKPPPALKTLSVNMHWNDEALKANADDAARWFERAIILEGFGRNEEALMALERAGELNTDPSDLGGSARFMKARLLQETERYLDALRVYDEIIGLVDADVLIQALAWVKKAEIFVKLSKGQGAGNQDGLEDNRTLKEEALANVERAIALQPDFVEAWVHMANILKDLERYEESLIAYDQSLNVRPYYAIQSGNAINALWEKAELLRNHFKNYEEALDAYNAVLPFADDDGIYAVMMHKGSLLENLGHYEACRGHMKRQPGVIFSV